MRCDRFDCLRLSRCISHNDGRLGEQEAVPRGEAARDKRCEQLKGDPENVAK